MRMKDWNEGGWLQWLHSTNINDKSKTNGQRLIYEMDNNWPYPRLQSLISQVNTFESKGWKYSCPIWLDNLQCFNTYGRLFTIVRFGIVDYDSYGYMVRIKIDDIDDGDNIYVKGFNTKTEAEETIDKFYEDFCKDEIVFDGVYFKELIEENGYQRV